MVKREQGIPSDLARLRGVRLVVAAETDQGRRLSEEVVRHRSRQGVQSQFGQGRLHGCSAVRIQSRSAKERGIEVDFGPGVRIL